MSSELWRRAPFPYWGGKRRAAHLVWQGLGAVDSYVEPFGGTCAVLFNSPYGVRPREVINDIDGFITNMWRALKYAPAEVAASADYPTSHLDLTARKIFLREHYDSLVLRLAADMQYYDAHIAGLWLWTVCNSISLGRDIRSQGVSEMPHLKDRPGGRGCNVQVTGTGERPHLKDRPGGQGCNVQATSIPACAGEPDRLFSGERLLDWFFAIAKRLEKTYILCKDWETLLSDSVAGTTKSGGGKSIAGIFLDPPYETRGRSRTYSHDSLDIAGRVYDWCIAHGENRQWRICLAGYTDDYQEDFPDGWQKVVWGRDGTRMGSKAEQGYDRTEALWFSPACLPVGDALQYQIEMAI